MKSDVDSGGFTLIELLIVVAIIGILAAIAIPNFLEAQVRAKVSRAVAEMRTLGTALELYCVDEDVYPMTSNYSGVPDMYYRDSYWTLQMLTTPIEYLTTLTRNPFWDGDPAPPSAVATGRVRLHGYEYADTAYVNAMKLVWNNNYGYVIPPAAAWRLTSPGPTRYYWWYGLAYDPSNGTVSDGNIIRFGPGAGDPLR